MYTNDPQANKHVGPRRDDALTRLDAAAKQLAIAAEKADGQWQTAAIDALRRDLTALQRFQRASELSGKPEATRQRLSERQPRRPL